VAKGIGKIGNSRVWIGVVIELNRHGLVCRFSVIWMIYVLIIRIT